LTATSEKPAAVKNPELKIKRIPYWNIIVTQIGKSADKG
jgi:hypothetical protein